MEGLNRGGRIYFGASFKGANCYIPYSIGKFKVMRRSLLFKLFSVVVTHLVIPKIMQLCSCHNEVCHFEIRTGICFLILEQHFKVDLQGPSKVQPVLADEIVQLIHTGRPYRVTSLRKLCKL